MADTTPIKAPERVTLYRCTKHGLVFEGLPRGAFEHAGDWYCYPCYQENPDAEYRRVEPIEYERPAHHTVPRELAVELAEALRHAETRLAEVPPFPAKEHAGLVQEAYYVAREGTKRAQSSGLLEPDETGAG